MIPRLHASRFRASDLYGDEVEIVCEDCEHSWSLILWLGSALFLDWPPGAPRQLALREVTTHFLRDHAVPAQEAASWPGWLDLR